MHSVFPFEQESTSLGFKIGNLIRIGWAPSYEIDGREGEV